MSKTRSKIQKERLTLDGKAKFFHKLARGVLFPVFHPIVTLVVLFVVWFAPTLMGVKPNKVHTWYSYQITNFFDNAITPIAENKIPNLRIKKAPIIGIDEVETKPKTTHDVNNRREIFLKTVSKQKEVFKQKETLSEGVTNVSVQRKPIVDKSEPKDLGLNYLETPEIVNGSPIVINANQIMIEGKYMFLYGIYVDPLSNKGKEAQDYLINLVSGKDITCSIIAYSVEGAATALCNIEQTNINKILVDKGLSQNVSLGK